jgi:type VI protein secretion system component Hcp
MFMTVKGASAAGFPGDSSGGGKTRCLAVRFRGDVPHDVRKSGAHAVTQHEPITAIRAWGPSSAQILTALWNNQILEEVRFDFLRDEGEKDIVYATLTLTQATVAFVELRSGDTEKLLAGDYRALEVSGFHAEKIEFKIKDTGGDATANYDRKAQS